MPSGIHSHKNKGPSHHNWRGDAVKAESGRQRARNRYPLKPCEHCGKKGTDRHHKDGNTLNNEPDNIAILCRRCHMLADGRMEYLKGAQSINAAKRVKPLQPCVNCGILVRVRRKELCRRCYDYKVANNADRPKTKSKLKSGPPRGTPSPCPICGRITRLKTKSRCVVCYNFWRINGVDRQSPGFRKTHLQESDRNSSRTDPYTGTGFSMFPQKGLAPFRGSRKR